VYGRNIPALREIAEPIIREWVEEDVELRWMDGRGTRGERVETGGRVDRRKPHGRQGSSSNNNESRISRGSSNSGGCGRAGSVTGMGRT